MKNKITFYIKYMAIIIALICITDNSLFAQGNSGNNGQGKLWEKNNATGNIYNTGLTNYVGIGTDNPISPLQVAGKVIADSLQVTNYINADSMHVRSLRVGDSSLWIGSLPTPGFDYIRSNMGYINIGNYDLANFFNITVAIAKTVTQPNINPYANIKLDVGGGINIDENQGYCIYNNIVLSNKGNSNLFVGGGAGANNISSTLTGAGNTFVGDMTGAFTTTGSFNLMCGNNTGFLNTTGSYNVFLGPAVDHDNVSGSYNTFTGHGSGYKNKGNNNVFYGYRSGLSNTTGNNNTYIGYQAEGTATLNNAAAIGNSAKVLNDNDMILGNNSVQVGIGLSTDPSGPQTKLEIDAGLNGTLPSLPGTVGASGLRFRDLRSLNTTVPNPNNVFLSVNKDGDVILVDGGGGGGADFDWYNQATLTNVTTTVDDDLYTNGNVFINVQTALFPSMTDIRFSALQDFGAVNNVINVRSVGGWFRNVFNHSIIPAGGISQAYGVRGQAIGGCGNKSHNYGGYFEAYNAEHNFAGYFLSKCNDCGTHENYGIFASVPVDCGDAVWIDGNVTITGNKSKLSDARFKTNVNTITSALNIIEQLNPVTFDFTTQPELPLPSGNQFGLIAQEVELVLPNVVTTDVLPAKFDSLGNMVSDTIMFKGVNYEAFIPILIAAVKDQQTQMDSMQQVINSIVTQLASCCDTTMNNKISVNTETGNSINVELASKGAILYQNTPNPFGEGTAIRYFIPDGVNDARIVFYDEYGSEIKNVPISDVGNGQLNINSMNLASGLYTYSLIVNNKIVDTKKMIRTKK